MEIQKETFEEGFGEGDCGEYAFDDDRPRKRKRKKRDREREYTRKFVRQLKREGARVKRYKDLGWTNPYDGWIYYHQFMPFEAKFIEGGKSYNIERWKKNQPHQYKNLLHDLRIGAKPFILIFWKPKRRILWLAAPIKGIDEKIYMDEMHEVNSLEKLMDMF